MDAIEAIVRAIGTVLPEALPEGGAAYALHEPDLTQVEFEGVAESLARGFVSSAMPVGEWLETELCERTGARQAVVLSSGTAALHLALLDAGVEPGDEVLMPSLSFVATANAAAYCGATPHFVDVDASSYGIDPDRLRGYLEQIAHPRKGRLENRRTGRRLAAIVAVHAFGRPCNLQALRPLSMELGIPLIEDAAAALGSRHLGTPIGGTGRYVAISFNGNKIVTAGGGGCLLSDDAEAASRARHLSTTARVSHAWRVRHDAVGFNYRMPSLNAALARSQLSRLPDFLERKHALFEGYRAALKGVPGARVQDDRPYGCSNHWLTLLELDASLAGERDRLLEQLHARRILARPAWDPLHSLPMYGDAPRDDLAVTDRVASSLVCLPSGSGLARQLGLR